MNSISIVKEGRRAGELGANAMNDITEGVQAIVIGKITEARGILVVNKTEKDVLPPTRDELFSI